MRDRVIAGSAVAIAGFAVVVGLTIGALGGAFDESGETVQPPALRSNLSTAVSASSSPVITVPPSPTWEVAKPTTPRPTTTVPTTTTERTTTEKTTTRKRRTTEETTTEETTTR